MGRLLEWLRAHDLLDRKSRHRNRVLRTLPSLIDFGDSHLSVTACSVMLAVGGGGFGGYGDLVLVLELVVV